MNKQLTKCDFCKYFLGRRCSVTPNSGYCRDALDEFYAYLDKLKKKRR